MMERYGLAQLRLPPLGLAVVLKRRRASEMLLEARADPTIECKPGLTRGELFRRSNASEPSFFSSVRTSQHIADLPSLNLLLARRSGLVHRNIACILPGTLSSLANGLTASLQISTATAVSSAANMLLRVDVMRSVVDSITGVLQDGLSSEELSIQLAEAKCTRELEKEAAQNEIESLKAELMKKHQLCQELELKVQQASEVHKPCITEHQGGC
jgi:hypothetical protein